MMVPMIQIEVSRNRKLEIKKCVLATLQKAGLATLPTKIKGITRSIENIRLISFSKHMKQFHLTYKQMLLFTESEDACTDYYADSNIFLIYYNDIKPSIVNSNRYRWNIAHELGHVILNHHANHIKTRIFRSTLSDYEYNVLEAEADYFAQLILVPHAVLYMFNINNASQIEELCKISGPASKKRYNEYKKWKQRIDGNDLYDKALFYLYYDYIFKKHCATCDVHLIQAKGKYCIICGQKTLQWGNGKMIYSKQDVYENGKLKECPNCRNEETNIEGDFCQICGMNLVNKCSNSNCSYTGPLPSNARYCPICGCNSTFFDSNFLKPWNYTEPPQTPNNSFSFEEIEELPFT